MNTWPYGFGICHCGCGQHTKPARQTNRAEGWVKGQPLRYLYGHKIPPHKRLYLPTDPDYVIDQDSGCWTWLKGTNGVGYGMIYYRHNKAKKLAHRAYYEQHKGPIPEGLVIDHLCRNRGCVNPEHLEPVENVVNVLRGSKIHNTHCGNGHEYTPENTQIASTKRGSGKFRRCRACHRIGEANRRAKIKAAA